MGNVSKHLLEPLAKLFGPMPAEDGNAEHVLATYERVLCHHSDAVLAKAYTDLAGSFVPSKSHPWPAAALCAKACARHTPAEVVGGADAAFLLGLRKRREASRLWAQDWLRTTVQGRQAVAQGWGHEAAIEVAQMHYAAAAGGREVGFAEIVMSDARAALFRRTYGRSPAA